jgi:hypothetical protein
MMRTVAVALAVLATIDSPMFGETYMHVVKQVANMFRHHVL